MTYLNIMNNVLRRLREEEVTTVNESTYSRMVGDFINDAKTIVEQAADWSALRETITPGTGLYMAYEGFPEDVFLPTNPVSLTGSGDDVKVLSAINDTGNCYLEYRSKDWFNEKIYLNTELTGSPQYYTFDGIDSNGDTKVRLYPEQDKNYTLRFDVIKRQAELTANDDNLLVPEKPVIHLAVALLARERGETGGTSTAEYFAIADKYLSDAIAIDAAKHPEEMIFRTI
jgi:hypothetical protein